SHLRCEVRRRNEVDVVTTARLQLKHHLRQTFVRYFIAQLFFMCLRDLIILTVDTAQIAVAEENITGAARAYQRRLLAKVSGIRRDDRQPSGITGGDFILQAIVEAVARTDSAALEQRLERGHPSLQLVGPEESQHPRP